MPSQSDYLPTATLGRLQLRAKLLAAVRRFFDVRGYFEVDTPLLSQDRVIDPHLEPFHVDVPATTLYLQTSPEFAMKRLLAAGAQAIYQVAHVFRAGELGRLHNPEFTMVEWYRAGDTHLDQMQVVEDLVVELFCESASGPTTIGPVPFLRTTYREAFKKHAGCDVILLDNAGLAALARAKNVAAPDSLNLDDRDGWLNLLLAELVEPHLGQERPEFLIDYPASQAAIARIRDDDPPVAERFELYIRGIELCNGYHELTDVHELRRRMEVESRRLIAAGQPALATSSRLLAAMEAGLPQCAGVALGFDRLLMLAVGAQSLEEVIAFPFERA
ncbi:MAG TPA: EF-P lysine aminoacylase EpmA [Planctomycetaceae bacterium]|jgi:lysyl-tRNA synthetase class 2